MNKLKLSSPWVLYYKKIDALFGKDPDIKIVFDEDTTTINMYVDNQKKAEALNHLLPLEKTFGSVTVHINIIPSNMESDIGNIFIDALSGNPVFEGVVTIEGIFTNPVTYVVFKKEVVQFFGDNLGDINGNFSTLYQTIAEEVFDKQNVNYCTTDTEE